LRPHTFVGDPQQKSGVSNENLGFPTRIGGSPTNIWGSPMKVTVIGNTEIPNRKCKDFPPPPQPL